jgi:hypothetical protein
MGRVIAGINAKDNPQTQITQSRLLLNRSNRPLQESRLIGLIPGGDNNINAFHD